ncbi:UPF0496 protein 1-like [Salvia miltiorrhiza]|uniref:UPF0496 protein 1-like n=1 Tax=Salvia miltiorrhiza TaxID=226208 RepID=UPI0025AB95A0|nr:UPF0496 protein 1-like [Salvia miltiorrhiza]
MGIQISRINRSRSSLRPQPQPPPPPRTASDPTPSSSSPDLSSYEAACRADPDLRSFDSSVQLRTSRAINSIAVGLDARALSLDSLSQVTECLLEMNQEVVQIILLNKRDVWKNPELSDLVDDYFDNSLLTLDFCTALDACLRRAGHIESILNVALRRFREEHAAAAADRNYAGTLEELANFRAAGDPFTEEFFRIFNSIYSRQIAMFERLQAKKRKLDKKLRRLKSWRRISNVIFITLFASVLICSVVAAAVSAPPVVTALAAAAAVPLGSMGKWLNSMWKNYERDLRGQTEILSSMQIGSYIVLNDLDSIKRLVERFEIVIEALVAEAEFAARGEEAVVVAVEEMRRQLDSFINTIQELRKEGQQVHGGDEEGQDFDSPTDHQSSQRLQSRHWYVFVDLYWPDLQHTGIS